MLIILSRLPLVEMIINIIVVQWRRKKASLSISVNSLFICSLPGGYSGNQNVIADSISPFRMALRLSKPDRV